MNSDYEKIPRVIHCCWFGRNQMPPLTQNCMASWKKYCPDYEIHIWNEDNFNLTECRYVQQAYIEKKWAFVTDYVRLWALYNYGGIYMDTDVEVLKPIDMFLCENFFSGFENKSLIPTGIMGAKSGNEIIKDLLLIYAEKSFYKEDGSLDLTPNTITITNYALSLGLQKNNQEQILYNNKETFHIYPNYFFCPGMLGAKEYDIQDTTFTIHHFAGSWHSEAQVRAKHRGTRLRKLFGARFGSILNSILLNYETKGLKGVLKKLNKKNRLYYK